MRRWMAGAALVFCACAIKPTELDTSHADGRWQGSGGGKLFDLGLQTARTKDGEVVRGSGYVTIDTVERYFLVSHGTYYPHGLEYDLTLRLDPYSATGGDTLAIVCTTTDSGHRCPATVTSAQHGVFALTLTR